MPARETRSMRICKTFKAAQQNMGYTQADVAKRLDVKQSTVSKWYKYPDMMSVGSLRLLCQVLSISPGDILSIN